MKMYMQLTRWFGVSVLVVVVLMHRVEAQPFVSGSTGADGAFNPTCTPTPCIVNVPLPPSGIFNFTTVNIPASVTVKFVRNAGNTPVVMLATGDVTIGSGGKIDIDGESGGAGRPGRGGPGGFDGGLGGSPSQGSLNGSPGLGPGGGTGGRVGVGDSVGSASGGGFGSIGGAPTGVAPGASYGVDTLLPLLGGSGGGGGVGSNSGPNTSGPGGGGGGGAILIASSGNINVGGTISARGGTANAVSIGGVNVFAGCGSGGGIRLAANSIGKATGVAGTLDVVGNTTTSCFRGGQGYVRLEAYDIDSAIRTLFDVTGSAPSKGFPGTVLPGTTFPSVKIVDIGGVGVPATTRASFFSAPDAVLSSSVPNPITVQLQAANVPLGTVIAVNVVTEGVGTRTVFNSTPLAGTFASSTAMANVTLPPGTSVLTATALFAAP